MEIVDGGRVDGLDGRNLFGIHFQALTAHHVAEVLSAGGEEQAFGRLHRQASPLESLKDIL